MLKALWDAKFGDSTWEMEEIMREACPYLVSGK